MAPFFSNLLNSPSFPSFPSFGAGPSSPPTATTHTDASNEAGPSTSPQARPRPEQRRQASTTSTNLSVAGLSIDNALDAGGRTGRGGGQSRPTSWAPSTMTVNELGKDMDAKERRRRKKKVAVETFIIVKPPPTASKHSMNLQIQLVMKPASSRSRIRADSITGSIAIPLSLPPSPEAIQSTLHPDFEERGTRRASAPPETVTFVDQLDDTDKTDEEPPVECQGLTRSNSMKSNISGASSKSIASTGSSLGGGRRIVPLYNLSVHNVMHATVVTDAGTDARVAKFLKRSLEISGIGLLEPTEIWQPSILNSPFSSAAEDQPISRPLSLLAPLSPTSTRGMSTEDSMGRNIRASLEIKLFSGGLFSPNQQPNDNAGEPEGSASKKLFGRMFKKKDTSPYTSRKSPATSRTSLDKPAGSPSALGSPGLGHAKLGGSVPPPNTGEHAQIGLPTFGTAPLIVRRRSTPSVITGPTLASAGSLPLPTITSTSRAIGYSWAIKRWAKGNIDSWTHHLVAAANAGLDLVGAAPHEEHEGEVVFEWVKLRSSVLATAVKRPSTERRFSGPRARSKSRGPSNLNPTPSPAQSQSSLLDPVVSPSPVSKRSASPAPSRGEDDSDPEDSETPWTCSVWVKGTGEKQLLATLTPAPHHPKVVGVLKVPMDLTIVPLAATQAPSADQAEAAKRVRSEVALTEENLKDVVCVTAMWLVVREEFGGLGKRRKA